MFDRPDRIRSVDCRSESLPEYRFRRHAVERSVSRGEVRLMETRGALRLGVLFLILATALFVTATTAAAAAGTDPATYEYHAVELLDDGSQERTDEQLTIVLGDTASEGDRIEIALDEDERDAFEITGASSHSDDVGVNATWSAETIAIELTDLGGDNVVSGTRITVSVDLRADETIVGSSKTRNSTAVAHVVGDGTDGELTGQEALAVSVAEAGSLDVTAEEIDERAQVGLDEVLIYGDLALSFAGDNVTANHGDSINISVSPNAISTGDEDNIVLKDAYDGSAQSDKLQGIKTTISNESNILKNSADQITVTLNTTNKEIQSISETGISLSIIIESTDKSMRSAANRYHETDLFEVDVEGENNTELTDNADVRTESPAFFNIYPSEVEEFELNNVESGAEIGLTENRSVGIETARDRFGNEVREPVLEATLSGGEDTCVSSEIEFETDERVGPRLGRGGDIDPPIGVFDLALEVTDIEGPKSHDPGAVTETIENVTVYPDDVQVESVGRASDFDADNESGGVRVDLGDPDARIDRLDLEIRKTTGEGTLRFAGGDPTPTAPWTDTEYGGDGELRPENPWVIERGLTGEDFDDGVRTYALETETPDSYGIAIEAMPAEQRLVPDDTDVRSSTVGEHGNETRGSTEIVATGPIRNVTGLSVATDYEFVGTDIDPGANVTVDIGAFRDANGNRVSEPTETVTLGLGNETVGTDTGGGVTTTVDSVVDSSGTSIGLDQTEIDLAAVETGTNATVAVVFGNERRTLATEITLVHRVREPDGGTWSAGSIPQPATLYVDAEGTRDLTQWNATVGRYESVADATEADVLHHGRITAEDLHRGFYFSAADDDARLGFDFVTDAEATDLSDGPETVELDDGWHLGSSNYDGSEYTGRELTNELRWVEYALDGDGDAFDVWSNTSHWPDDRTETARADGSETIAHGDAYWIRVTDGEDAPLVRDVVVPTFTEDRGNDE